MFFDAILLLSEGAKSEGGGSVSKDVFKYFKRKRSKKGEDFGSKRTDMKSSKKKKKKGKSKHSKKAAEGMKRVLDAAKKQSGTKSHQTYLYSNI